MAVLRDVWANYRDESFIRQFLSPRLMRHLRMFHLHDDPAERAGIRVDAIHDERGYRRVRRELARQYDVGFIDPNIEVVDVDLAGDRRLILHHRVVKGAQLNETETQARAAASRRSLELRRLADRGRPDRHGPEGVCREPARTRRRRRVAATGNLSRELGGRGRCGHDLIPSA